MMKERENLTSLEAHATRTLQPETPRIPYEAPKVISYTDEEMLEALGPVQAGTGYGLNG